MLAISHLVVEKGLVVLSGEDQVRHQEKGMVVAKPSRLPMVNRRPSLDVKSQSQERARLIAAHRVHGGRDRRCGW